MPRPKTIAPGKRYVAIRLHRIMQYNEKKGEDERINLQPFFDDNFTDYVCVEETATRTHYHIHGAIKYVDNANFQNIARALKSTISGLSGNGDYSVKKSYDDVDGNEVPCDEAGYKYVCKGTGPDFKTQGPIVIATSFTTDRISDFHQEWWMRRKLHLDKVGAKEPVYIGEPKRQKKMPRQAFTERVILHLQEEFKRHEIDFNPHQPAHRFMVLRTILDNMARNTMQIDAGNLIVSRMYYTVVNGLVPLEHHSRRRQLTAGYYEAIFGSECPVVQHPTINLALPPSNANTEI